MNPIFTPFPPIRRLARPAVVTEKIDGTNAQVIVVEKDQYRTGPRPSVVTETGDYVVYAASRKRLITPGNDNFGFAQWVLENAEELAEGLGPGSHVGEWWGSGIQRGYGLDHKRFSLFNTNCWVSPLTTTRATWDPRKYCPECCHVVPTLAQGLFSSELVYHAMQGLREFGSYAAPGYRKPEGVVVYHIASGVYFKKTLENDQPKGYIS